jgi:GT2 family glycosyltransferase/tetratricopeptide (TPR) repeat protein
LHDNQQHLNSHLTRHPHIPDGTRHQADDGATVVIVTYNSETTIGDCLHSLTQTLRLHDEVILIDNASRDLTCDRVQAYTDADKRFQLHCNSTNRGYAQAVNQGAKLGTQPFIVFLNPDTLVTPQWLDRLIYHLQPDKRAAAGPLSNYVAGLQKVNHYLPGNAGDHCGADRLMNTLWRQNQRQCVPTKLLVGFCLMVKRSLFESIGGMDEHLFLGNDDLDLSWRLQEAGYELVVAKDTMVFHKGQVSFASEPQATTNRLVEESTDYLYYKLVRHYGLGQVPTPQALWAMDWFKPTCQFNTDRPLASIVLLTWNQLDYTRQCIESLFKYTHSAFELIIIDNGSTDGTLEYLQELDRAHTACIRIETIANSNNVGFAKGCNQGLAVSRGDYLILLNNDVVLTSQWLQRLTRAVENDQQLGLVGPMTNYVSGPQRITNPTYDVNTLNGLEKYAHIHAETYDGQIASNWRIAGFCMLMRRAVIEKIGGLDERYAIGNFEDDDFCARAHLAGYKAAVIKDCYLHHYGGRTFVGNQIDYDARMNANWMVFKQKWNIPGDTPLGREYSLPIPTGGFDAAKHYVPITSEKSKAASSTKDRSRIAGEDQPANRPFAKPLVAGYMQTDIAKNNTTGGNPMSTLDQVYEFTKQQIAPQHNDVAIWILERICQEAHDHGRAHHELGLLHFERNEPDKAQHHLERAASIDPENPSFAKDLGDFYHVVCKDTHSALEKYTSVLQRQPDDQDTLLKAGHLHMAAKQYEMAKECYTRLLSLNPNHSEAHTFVEKLDEVLKTSIRQASPEELYAQAHERLGEGDNAGALVLLDQVIELDPQNALAHNDHGVLSFEQNDKEKAMYHYERAVDLAPENITFLKNLADFCWVERGDAGKALKQYIQVLQVAPSDMETLINCGQICMALKKNDDARDFFNRAQQIEPWNENVKKLLDDLEQMTHNESQPFDRDTLHRQAQSKAAAGDLAGAISDLDRILEKEPENATLYNDIGVLNYEAGDMEKALSCYEQAVRLAPDHTEFQKNLADFYMMEQGRAEDAMKLYVKMLEKDPQDVDCLLACGLVCICMKKTDDARIFFQRVIEIEPWNASGRQGLEQLDDTGKKADVASDVDPAPFHNQQVAN